MIKNNKIERKKKKLYTQPDHIYSRLLYKKRYESIPFFIAGIFIITISIILYIHFSMYPNKGENVYGYLFPVPIGIFLIIETYYIYFVRLPAKITIFEDKINKQYGDEFICLTNIEYFTFDLANRYFPKMYIHYYPKSSSQLGSLRYTISNQEIKQFRKIFKEKGIQEKK